jgi:maltose alpha-D-glucosyltransferase/alpha-amylase
MDGGITMATAELITDRTIASSSTRELRSQADTALWFKDAIIYQLHVRAFRDANNDGIGDFRGLTEKLDYLQDLGVTAVWLQPFFPSPLRDDGYDIADYTNVNPQYGTLEDFQAFLEEAHRRDLRVITELVMNHTSDQHDWFQRSRRAAPGSPWRDWYVWSDTPDKYQEARIIFQDFETSNWSWDPIAGVYFWHRFYSHQPDLNFDNPDVRTAMFEILDFWLAIGVDGLRLDAVPYLFEREGTNCENLPETHAFLRELRAHIDKNFSGKMLLAEANQWPEDAAAYFGDGDECHMNFHFPLMPRLFMAVEREDRSPIVDILEQTPLLPPSCQWAIFLRNHDELTLEMVTDEERDYMYRTYTLDSKARINLGIRRRLAPLMGNNRRKIELMNSLLLSLPGTPILYYGDEIGMGDNYYLGDRNGVRTPMQWSGDRNAGFSRANPQSLYLPTIIDPEYHYELRNVEVQHANPHSLLWWTRRILDLRKHYPAFGNGSFENLPTSNPKIFAFIRENESETLLVVANLSRLSQHTELDLSRYGGKTPTELFGYTSFPVIGDEPYRLSLGPHGFFWFCLSCKDESADEAERELPTIHIRRNPEELFAGRRQLVLGGALEPYLRRQRWFAGKARRLQKVEPFDHIVLIDAGDSCLTYLLLLTVSYADGEPDSYCVPVNVLNEDEANELLTGHPLSGIARIKLDTDGSTKTLCEATRDDRFWKQLFSFVSKHFRASGNNGALYGIRTTAYERLAENFDPDVSPTIHGGEQSNTSATFHQHFMLKLFRRITPGINPDLEIGRHLTERHELTIIPQVAGALEYRDSTAKPWTLAVLNQWIPNIGDAWTYTLDELDRYFERVQAVTMPGEGGATESEESPQRSIDESKRKPLIELSEMTPPQLALDMIGGYLSSAELLGRRIGELHMALASFIEGAAFAPESFTRLYQRGLYQSMRSQARATIDLLRSQKHTLNDEAQAQAAQLLECERSLYAKFAELTYGLIDARRIRCHGDLHLGQVLFTGKDFVIIDFEGEPERPVSERRIKASPLRDVAGMLRSFHYAAHAAIRGQSQAVIVQHAAVPVDDWANFWSTWVSAAFLRTYLIEAEKGGFLPRDHSQLESLLRAYLLEKALYELRYELNNRPEWVNIPLEGIRQYCGSSKEESIA